MNKAMQILVSYLLAGICSAAFANDRRPRTDDDHLIPIGGRIELAYERLLNQRLFVTPANYARILNLASPASVGEFAISIYSKRKNADEVWITTTRAERNLWYAEFGKDPDFPKKPAVKVARCDALFPQSIAVAVSEAIERMLRQSRPFSKSGRIIVDATDVEYSVENQEGKRIRALLTPDSHGKRSDALRRLTQLLEEYCEGSPAGQAALEKKIEAEARRLGK